MSMQWNENRSLSLLRRSFEGLWLVDVATGLCTEYTLEGLAPFTQMHYDQWLITLSREMHRADAAGFFNEMTLSRVRALLDSGTQRCTVYYRLPKGPEWELSLFYLDDDTRTLAVTRRAIPANRPGPLSSADALARSNDRLNFLVSHVVENLIEVNVRTGDCCMLNGSNGMESFPTLKEQVAWWADHLIAPEERAAFLVKFDLNHLVGVLRANNGYSYSTYATVYSRTISITCRLYRPQYDSRTEFIYAYSTDVSQYKEQEERNKQLVDISQQLLTLSQTDTLTNLYNRTAAEKFIDEHLMACRHEQAGTLLLIDIDNFKEFNDNYGHQVGDFVLHFFGKCMQDIFRSDDILCRWGGDEFMIFMRDVSRQADVESRVQRLRARTRRCAQNNAPLNVTISIGGAVAHRGDGLKSIFALCDKMLYQVKKQGRNGFLLFHQ